MRWSEVEARLLPRSGVGVVAPWLVIAPPGNPVIRLDLRLMDRVDSLVEESGAHSMLLVCGELEVAIYIADGADAVTRLTTAAAPFTRSGQERGRLPAAASLERTAPMGGAKLIITAPIAEGMGSLAWHRYELSGEHTTIGRTDANDIVLPHRSISRRHAEITRDAVTGRYCIAELGASNALRVNGKEHASCALEDRDVIDLGHVRMRFESRSDMVFEEAGPAALERALIVGNDAVRYRDDVIEIGDLRYRLSEVREYALQGANLPLPNGCLIQAALTLFVVPAAT